MYLAELRARTEPIRLGVVGIGRMGRGVVDGGGGGGGGGGGRGGGGGGGGRRSRGGGGRPRGRFLRARGGGATGGIRGRGGGGGGGAFPRGPPRHRRYVPRAGGAQPE